MTNEQIVTTLLDICRLEMQITWQDDDTNSRLINHIKNGVKFIKDRCGVVDEDFEAGGKANALFLAYVRRGMSGDLSTFEKDYLSDIVGLQTEYEVSNYAEEQL